MECYMIMGGIPFYQSLLRPGLSLAQNIDNLFFNSDGELVDEFENLYASLFDNSESYVKVVEALSKKNKGITREEIQESVGVSGGTLSRYLHELEGCDLIRSYSGYGRRERKTVYQLVDFYTLFYYKFIRGHVKFPIGYWMHIQGTPKHNAWCGYAFEQLCISHYPQISASLEIGGILTEVYSWTSQKKEGGAQIDLVIKRADRVVNVCEMKYWKEPYRLTQKYVDELQHKVELFREECNIVGAIHLVMITTNGIANPSFSSLVQREVTAKELFKEL